MFCLSTLWTSCSLSGIAYDILQLESGGLFLILIYCQLSYLIAVGWCVSSRFHYLTLAVKSQGRIYIADAKSSIRCDTIIAPDPDTFPDSFPELC